eukprot:TRINITY_DN2341_c0_g1_i1.p1 TRINITY_DN2341_c0_g1~~TRINITY_DN2341_c0_g1_i1.p1  ORF type:complete len:779 (+),score=231.19 TRINITY_DN2341_c0_g1_i1:106-2337(+)
MEDSTQEEMMSVVHPLDKAHFRRKGETDAQVRWAKFKNQNNIWTWLFLGLAGFIITIVLVCIDLVIRLGVFRLRDRIVYGGVGLEDSDKRPYAAQYVLWVLWTMVLSLLAATIVKKLCYAAAGSGVPDLKSIYCGFYKKEPLAPPVFLFKAVALMLSYGSGLSVGKEGPYVHLAAVMANTLLLVPVFGNLVAPNQTRRTHFIAACSALGIAATFGSPIGGVLFGIEVMAVYYLNVNYWRSFFAAAVGAVAVKIVVSDPSQALLESFSTKLPPIALDTVEIFAFVLLGVLCGFLGSLFIWMYQQVITLKKKYAAQLTKITWAGEVAIVALVTGLISFPLEFLRFDHARAVHSLFTNEEIEDWYDQFFPNDVSYEDDPEVIHTPSVRGAILIATLVYTVVKLCLTVVAITLPIPYGIYIPLFAIGAAFGRGIGEGMALLSGWFQSSITIVPRGYAAIGAAALCGGATRTVSSAMIILELTNDLNYFIPVLLAVTISCGIGNMLNHSIYDVFVRIKGLPYLPFLRVKGDSTVAHDIMDRTLFFVAKKTSVKRLQELLSHREEVMFPIVESNESLQLVGAIKRKILERIVEYCKDMEGGLGMAAEDALLSQEEGGQPLRTRASRSRSSNVPLSSLGEEEGQSSATDAVQEGAGLGDDAGRDAIILSNLSGQEAEDISVDLNLFALNHSWVEMDNAPFQVVDATPVRKILFMFTMLGGSVLWVTYKGKLVGTITKQNLVKSISGKSDH